MTAADLARRVRAACHLTGRFTLRDLGARALAAAGVTLPALRTRADLDRAAS